MAIVRVKAASSTQEAFCFSNLPGHKNVPLERGGHIVTGEDSLWAMLSNGITADSTLDNSLMIWMGKGSVCAIELSHQKPQKFSETLSLTLLGFPLCTCVCIEI